MARTFYIIDGYNLAHAAGLMPPGGLPVETWVVRDQLVLLIADCLSPRQRKDTTIVFDVGPNNTSVPNATTQNGIKLLFSIDEPDADSLIEKLVDRHNSPRQIVVVSSDRRVQASAKRRKGKFLSSPDFLRLLARKAIRTDRGESENRELTVPTGEVDQWLEFFGIEEEYQAEQEELEIPDREPKPASPTPRPIPPSINPQPSESQKQNRPKNSKAKKKGTSSKPAESKKHSTPQKKNSPPEKPEGELKRKKKQPLTEEELSFWTDRLSDLLDNSDQEA